MSTFPTLMPWRPNLSHAVSPFLYLSKIPMTACVASRSKMPTAISCFSAVLAKIQTETPPEFASRRQTSMPKNIVICCDGTANEFAEDRTNVVKLYYSLEQGAAEQVTF